MGVGVAKKDLHPKPHGPEVEFYLGSRIRGREAEEGEVIPISINGYKYEAILGQRNKLPKEVVQALLDAKSQTRVVDVEEAERNPRSTKRFQNAPTRVEYLNDYEIDIRNGWED